MTTFQTVNMILPTREHTSEATTPTTPRAPQTASSNSQQSQRVDISGPSTPTRLSFSGMDSQRPLPPSIYDAQAPFQTPLQPASQNRQTTLKREESHRSTQSNESMDIDMGESEEEEDGSDAESDDGQTGRPAKKKKGQRFFCTDFPPCNLSFTRSEHLARHIRKHTGERPFQCHCTRRFSRLDNLRQHAQTVHVNEEIPGDSLAATGTRFQRQIRTDRVRPPGPRSRASTAGSQGGHSRGHSRNLSASSVGSNASTISNNDVRRRPPSLMMPQDSSPQAKLSIDTRGHIATPPRNFAYMNSPSGGPNTPASSTYSNDPSSPFGSKAGSPIASGHRYSGSWQAQGHTRRLSVPSGANPFQPPHGQPYPPYFSPLTPASMSNNSSNSSLLASPVSSVYSFSSRHDPQIAEAESRRRTWHPSTYSIYPRPATSGLSYYQTPDAPRPSFAPQAVTAVNNSQRLPGIDAIDHFVNRPRTPQRNGPWPVENDSPQKAPVLSRVAEQPPTSSPDRRGHNSWDLSLHQNLTKLDLASGTPPKDIGIWGQQTIAEIQNAASSSTFGPLPPAASQPQPPTQQQQQQASQQQPSQQRFAPVIHQESQKRPADVDHYPTAKLESSRSRRNGWYNGPPVQAHQQQVHMRPSSVHRRSPEDSSSSDGIPTPSSTAGGMDPIILQNGGFAESQGHAGVHGGQQVRLTIPKPVGLGTDSKPIQHFTFPPVPKPQLPMSNSAPVYTLPQDTGMSGLEALVAAATSEEKLNGAPTQSHSH